MTINFEQYIRWDFLGLSTDTKPTPATSEKVTDGSTYYEVDTSKLYVYCKDSWYEKEDTGGGGGSIPVIKSLTEADKNCPEENPSYISLSRLPDGIYKKGDNTGVASCDSNVNYGTLSKGDYAVVCRESDTRCVVYVYHVNDGYPNVRVYTENNVSKSVYNTPNAIKDNLTSTSSIAALSANQGRILNEKINVVALPLTINELTGQLTTQQTCAQIKALIDAGKIFLPCVTLSDHTLLEGGIVGVIRENTGGAITIFIFDGESSQFILINLSADTDNDYFTGTMPS